MEVQPQLNQLTQFWLSQLSQMHLLTDVDSNGQPNEMGNCDYAKVVDHETANINATNENHRDASACTQNVDFTHQLANLFNQNNENFLTALLKKGTNQSTQSTQKQQQNALVPPTPPRTPITPSAQHQQVTGFFLFYSHIFLFTLFRKPSTYVCPVLPSPFTYIRGAVYYSLVVTLRFIHSHEIYIVHSFRNLIGFNFIGMVYIW